MMTGATAHQSKTDLIIVENMAKRYLADPRTIIMSVASYIYYAIAISDILNSAVGSSVNETANQKVFQLAREADATGTRTVGVLTKPDAIQEGDEGRVMDVARNKVTILYHGWLVVRNRSTDDINKGVTLEGRLKNEEAFFKTEPWRNLDKERVGIKSLEYFTRNLLYSHIRKEYPILVEELEKKVQDLRQAINKLGPARETPDQQRSVLIEISNNFQTLARDARMGLYHSSLDDVELRLRNSIRNLNDAFAKSVKEKGHLHDFFGEDTKMIHEWILKIHLRSRGVEMDGMVNPEVFKTLFRLQTESWGGIAGEHIMCVNNLVNEFIRRVLTDKCPDSELRSKLGGFLAPRFTATLDGAKEELQKILKVERGEVLLTYDDGFVKTLDDIRKQRMLGDITGSVLLKFDSEDTLNTSAKINNIFQESYKTREQQAVHEMHDYLKSYYTAARTRFIDCVCMQVVERHFLGEHGSVQAFSPATIGRLSTEELQGIAGEDFSIVSTRRTLKEKLARLEVAQTIANAGYV